jgi:hypothetical protein
MSIKLSTKQYSDKLTTTTECSPRSMVPVFIMHARWGLLGVDALAAAASVSMVLFGPQVLALAPGCLRELSACCVVLSASASSIGWVVAALLASSPANCVPHPLASSRLLTAGNSGKSLKARPKCYIQQTWDKLHSTEIKYKDRMYTNFTYSSWQVVDISFLQLEGNATDVF